MAQIAAVQGAVVFLWDLDERASVCAGIGALRDLEAEPGRVVRVSYDGERPIAVEAASMAELTPEQTAAMLHEATAVERDALYRLIWNAS